MEIDIATTNRDLAQARKHLVQAQCASPYILQNEINALEQVESLERGLDLAKKILSDRF